MSTPNYARGAMFMMVERVIKMLSELTMIVLLARYLGPDVLGQLMYSYAIVSMLGFLNALGMEGVVVKRFVERVPVQLSFLKHVFVLRFLFAILCVLLANGLGLFLVDESARWSVSYTHLTLPTTPYV